MIEEEPYGKAEYSSNANPWNVKRSKEKFDQILKFATIGGSAINYNECVMLQWYTKQKNREKFQIFRKLSKLWT